MTDHPIHQNHPVAGYFGAWRLSLRLARRDIRRHRGRAVLVVLLVGLPLLAIAAAGTFLLTNDVSAKEAIPRTMGAAQAALRPSGQPDAVLQSSDGESMAPMGDGSRPSTLPGLRPGQQLTRDALEGVTGGHVFPVTHFLPMRAQLGDRRVSLQALGIDGRQSVYRGMAQLTSGRWPAAADQVLVSQAGQARGAPTRGTLRMSVLGGEVRTVTVVGTVHAPGAEDLVMLPAGPADAWLLQRDTPVSWPEVKQLNRYGLVVQSRQVIEHPSEAVNDLAAQGIVYESTISRAVWVLFGTGLIIVVALLAGPAFAASAARYRRAIGLLASNGASRAQLRRYLLAQALLLGAIAAAVSLVLGGLIGWAAITVVARSAPTNAAPGPLEIRWLWALLLFVVAVLAALVAAFVPAVVASRLNLIEVLRGQVSARRVRAGWPLAGLLLAMLGGALLSYAIAGDRPGGTDSVTTSMTAAIVVGAIALFAGALTTTPWLLARLGDLAGHLPLALRVATRDVSRQRGRAVATTGAILATVAVFTALAVGYASSIEKAKAEYVAGLPHGDGSIRITDAEAVARTEQLVHTYIPRANLVPIGVVGPSADTPTASGGVPGIGAYTIGCSDDEALNWPTGTAGGSGCLPAIASSMGMELLAGDPAQLARTFRLDGRDLRALRAGRVLLSQRGQSVDYASAPTILRVVTGTAGQPGHTGAPTKVTAVHTAPVTYSRQGSFGYVPMSPREAQFSSAVGPDPAGLVSTQAAAALGAITSTTLLIDAPGGISRDQERAISERLNDTASMYVERGYRDDSAWMFLLIGAVFGLLVLVATLVSTGLSQAESHADSATFASLGAPARTRRAISATNAAVVGLAGSMLGLVVGLVPGIAASYPLTRVASGPLTGRTTTAVPWLPLVAVVVGVPLLAAILAGLVTRGRPPMTRRTT